MNINPNNPFLSELYKQTLNEISTNPKNQPLAVISALKAIQNDQTIEEKGLTKSSKKVLKDLADQMTKDPEGAENIKKDLKEKIQTLFKSSRSPETAKQQEVITFEKVVDSEDMMRHISGFMNKNDKKEVTLVSKEIKTSVDKDPDRQILALFRETELPSSFMQKLGSFFKKSLNLSTPLPPLQFPKGFDIEKTRISQYMPTKISYSQVLNGLLNHSASIEPGSDVEKLILYLMKVSKWDADQVLKQPWQEGSAIQKIAKEAMDVGDIMYNSPQDQESPALVEKLKDSELLRYPYVEIKNVKTSSSWNLPEWVMYRLFDKLYTDNKELVLLGLKGNDVKGNLNRAEPFFNKLSADLQEDKDVLVALMKAKSYEFRHLPDKWKKDPDIAEASMIGYPFNLKYFADELKKDKAFILKLFHSLSVSSVQYGKEKTDLLSELPDEIKNDEEIIFAALQWKNLETNKIREDLKTDRDFNLKAVHSTGRILGPFRDDKEIGLVAVDKNPYNFYILSISLRQDPDITEVIKYSQHPDAADVFKNIEFIRKHGVI